MEQSTSYQNSVSSTEEVSDEKQNRKKWWPWGKIIVGLILLGIIIFVIVDSVTNKHIASGFNAFLEWIEINPGWGALAL